MGIYNDISADLLSGLSYFECAERYHVTADFVRMIAERMDSASLLSAGKTYDKPSKCGDGTACFDPESIVCIACPFSGAKKRLKKVRFNDKFKPGKFRKTVK